MSISGISPLFLNRYTLDFGEVSYYLGYNAMKDFFPTWPMNPNPQCTNNACRNLQQQYKGWTRPVRDQAKTEKKVVHEDNEWGIELTNESAPVKEVESGPSAGLQYEYDKPNTQVRTINPTENQNVALKCCSAADY